VGEQDITEKITQPCPECGSTAVRLIPCDPPPLARLLTSGCIVSRTSDGVELWHSCPRVGRLVARLAY